MHEPRSNITTKYLLLSRAISLLTFNSIIKRKLIFLEIINSIDGKYYMASKNHASIIAVESICDIKDIFLFKSCIQGINSIRIGLLIFVMENAMPFGAFNSRQINGEENPIS